MLKIDPELALQVSSGLNYLNVMQMNQQYDSTVVDDNSGHRAVAELRSNPYQLQAILANLNLDQNKLLLLSLLRGADLIFLMGFMDKQQLILGLKFFDKPKLMQFISQLPWEVVINMLLSIFSPEDLILYLPTEQLLRVLRSSSLDERSLNKGLENFPLETLQLVMSRIQGRPCDNLKHAELLNMFMQTKKFQILDGLTVLPYKQFSDLVSFFTKKDPTLFQSLSQDFVFQTFDRASKGDLMNSFSILPNEILIHFLGELPQKMMAQVVSQMDTNLLGTIMMSKFPNLLLSLAA